MPELSSSGVNRENTYRTETRLRTTLLFPRGFSHEIRRTETSPLQQRYSSAVSMFPRRTDSFFVAVNCSSIHPPGSQAVPMLSFLLLRRTNADWSFLPQRSVRLGRDWLRLGWRVHRLLVTPAIVVRICRALQK